MTHRAVLFHRGMAPYEAGDVAGFPSTHAQSLVDRGIAAFHPPVKESESAGAETPRVPDILDAMDRAQLLAFSKDKLGVTDEPGTDVSDEDLRAAIRHHIEPADLQAAPQQPAKQKTKP